MQLIERRRAQPSPGDRVIVLIHRHQRTRIQQQRHVMRLAVVARHLPGQIRNRPRQQIHILRKGRREKRQRQRNARTVEAIDRVRGSDRQTGLSKRRRLLREIAHIAIALSVNANQPRQRLRRSGPMTRGPIGKLVVHRPDAEVRIMRHQRHGRWALLRAGCKRRQQQQTHCNQQQPPRRSRISPVHETAYPIRADRCPQPCLLASICVVSRLPILTRMWQSRRLVAMLTCTICRWRCRQRGPSIPPCSRTLW